MIGRKALIEGLNEDLAAEWGTIIRYTHQAGTVVGAVGQGFRQILQKEVEIELRHAGFLTEVIADLGGEPETIPQVFPRPSDLKGMLTVNLEFQLRDIENYRKHSKWADELGEAELRLKLEEISADESRHARELRRLLKGI